MRKREVVISISNCFDIPMPLLSRWLWFFMLFPLLISCDVYAQERRTALIIGISNYDGMQVSKLKNPVNDAEDFTVVLKFLGFDVILLSDPTRDQIIQAKDSFMENLDNNGVALFYFAGHAVQLPSNYEEYQNYMVPADVNLGIDRSKKITADILRANLVGLDDIVSSMGNFNKGINIVILDACRENPFRNMLADAVNGLTQTRGIKIGDLSKGGNIRSRRESQSNFFIAYSARYGSVAQDGKGRNSPFTKAILENIKKEGTIEDLFKQVRASVERETAGEQLPQEVSSLKGDFYFFKAKDSVRIIERSRKTIQPPPF